MWKLTQGKTPFEQFIKSPDGLKICAYMSDADRTHFDCPRETYNQIPRKLIAWIDARNTIMLKAKPLYRLEIMATRSEKVFPAKGK
jgi:hypothetical protein